MRSKWCVLLIVACIICSAPNIIGAEEALSLDQCISLALENNNLFKASGQEFLASRARVKQARAFPQPEFSYDSDLQPRFFNFKQSGESYVGISQLIEFPGRRYLRGKIAGKESDMVNCEVNRVRQEIIYNVKSSFYQLLLTIETQKYTGENLEMARDFLAKAKEKYESGEVAKFEMLRAKVEAAKAGNQLKVAVNQVKLAKVRLNFFLARDKFRPITIRGSLRGVPIELQLQELQARALASRPEIKKERLTVKKENLAKKQAFLSYLPDVSLGVARHRIDYEPTTWDITLSFEVPLFFWQKINGEIAEVNANLAAANERLKYLELSVGFEVESVYYNAISLQNQVRLFEKEVLDEAEQVYQMSMMSYREGKIGSIELIESRRSLVELKQVYAETLFNYQLALAELEKSLGTSMGKISLRRHRDKIEEGDNK
jgi:outer membrane protein TolC